MTRSFDLPGTGQMPIEHETVAVATLYIAMGLLGFACNIIIVAMILTVQAYHKSAYLLMANIAVGDAIQSLIVGCYVGVVILMTCLHDETNGCHYNEYRNRSLAEPMGYVARIVRSAPTIKLPEEDVDKLRMQYSISLLSIIGWFVMIYTYAALGLNRCVGTCFYKTKLKRFNRIRSTNIVIVVIWIVSVCGGVYASIPEPIIFVQPRIWTMRFVVDSSRSYSFVVFNVCINSASIAAQWTCSAFVLTTVRRIQKRISNHTISGASARRSQRQARLSFQFFYPSIICTLSSLMFFSMPLYAHLMTRWHFLVSHLVWLTNHICNPFIYFYFNGRMRETLRLWARCRRDIGHSVISKYHGTTALGYSMTPFTTTERRSTRDANAKGSVGIFGSEAGGVGGQTPGRVLKKSSMPHLHHYGTELLRNGNSRVRIITDLQNGHVPVPHHLRSEEEEEEEEDDDDDEEEEEERDSYDSNAIQAPPNSDNRADTTSLTITDRRKITF